MERMSLIASAKPRTPRRRAIWAQYTTSVGNPRPPDWAVGALICVQWVELFADSAKPAGMTPPSPYMRGWHRRRSSRRHSFVDRWRAPYGHRLSGGLPSSKRLDTCGGVGERPKPHLRMAHNRPQLQRRAADFHSGSLSQADALSSKNRRPPHNLR